MARGKGTLDQRVTVCGPPWNQNYASLATATACLCRYREFTMAISNRLGDGFWYFLV